MGTKRFNVKGEEQQERMKLFQETMNKIDKLSIIQAFLLGLEVGIFKYRNPKNPSQVINCNPNNDLFFQFHDLNYVYTITRMPKPKLRNAKNSPIAHAIMDKKRRGGINF